MNNHIAFLGTGIMGEPMCGHLLDSGFPVRAWNRTADKLAALAQRGVVACDSPAATVMGAECVMVMLSSGPVIDSVLFSQDSTGQCLADEIAAGAIVVVMSSIPVETARRQAALLAGRGIAYIDAPVSGGEKGAREANLSLMAGGETAVVEQARGLLEHFGRLTHVGPVGSGQLAKLANQTIVGITIDAGRGRWCRSGSGESCSAGRIRLLNHTQAARRAHDHAPIRTRRQGGDSAQGLADIP
jgi:3-hydroxyisobutyrate dehydrogenase-like beta-hydroxyacid dehydrogenase